MAKEELKAELKSLEGVSVSEVARNLEGHLPQEGGLLYEGLSPEAKQALIDELILQQIRLRGEEGLTAGEIAELTNVPRETVYRHLQNLTALREIYSVKKSRRLNLYFPNGRPLHRVGKRRIEDGDAILEVVMAQGSKGRLFLQVTEKRFSLLEGESIQGGIVVPTEMLPALIETLQELATVAEVTPDA